MPTAVKQHLEKTSWIPAFAGKTVGNGHKFARPEPVEGPASVRFQWSSTLRLLRQDKINASGSYESGRLFYQHYFTTCPCRDRL